MNRSDSSASDSAPNSARSDGGGSGSGARAAKVTRLRGRSLPETCKLVYGKAFELSKYDHYENGCVMKKGHLFVAKKNIPIDEYRRHVINLLEVFDQLGIQYATSVSAHLRKTYPDAEKIVGRLKSFYIQVESKVAAPVRKCDEDDSGLIFMYDGATRFQTMEAVFSGNKIEEAYDDDRFQLQCEEIEILLGGGQRTRDVGQEEEIKQLYFLLQGMERNGAISGSIARNTARTEGSVMNSARGPPQSARGPGPGTARGAPSRMQSGSQLNSARGPPSQPLSARGHPGMNGMDMMDMSLSARGMPGVSARGNPASDIPGAGVPLPMPLSEAMPTLMTDTGVKPADLPA